MCNSLALLVLDDSMSARRWDSDFHRTWWFQTLVWQNQEARGDHLEGKKWAKTRPGESSEEVSASEERAHALYTPETATANLKAIAGYSRNFLPLLFNLFVASAPEKRGDLQVSVLLGIL